MRKAIEEYRIVKLYLILIKTSYSYDIGSGIFDNLNTGHFLWLTMVIIMQGLYI